MFVKPMELVTLDLFIDEEYLFSYKDHIITRIYLEDLEPSTNYKIVMSYPEVIPVQYDLFLEEDSDDLPTFHPSIHNRRMLDTRIFSFRTDKYGDLYLMGEDADNSKPEVEFPMFVST